VIGPHRIGPCVGSVGKFNCIGLNYSDHAAEPRMAVAKEPVVFMKATSATHQTERRGNDSERCSQNGFLLQSIPED
jgi:2-keto-4-pentenoate hydratase/2-oxohepta-3-ene-1,7-dioic acid hydratase in catechol pathway